MGLTPHGREQLDCDLSEFSRGEIAGGRENIPVYKSQIDRRNDRDFDSPGTQYSLECGLWGIARAGKLHVNEYGLLGEDLDRTGSFYFKDSLQHWNGSRGIGVVEDNDIVCFNRQNPEHRVDIIFDLKRRVDYPG